MRQTRSEPVEVVHARRHAERAKPATLGALRRELHRKTTSNRRIGGNSNRGKAAGHRGSGFQRTKEEVEGFIRLRRSNFEADSRLQNEMAARAKESALKSKIRAASYASGGPNFQKLFHLIDSDGSGHVDFSEFLHALRRHGKISEKLFSESEMREIFDAVDVDQTGVIDIGEFLRWVGLTRSTRTSLLPQLAQQVSSQEPSDEQHEPSWDDARGESNGHETGPKDAAKPESALDMDIIEALENKNSEGPGLSKFWSVRHEALFALRAEHDKRMMLFQWFFTCLAGLFYQGISSSPRILGMSQVDESFEFCCPTT